MNKTQNERQANVTQGKDNLTENTDDRAGRKSREHKENPGKHEAKSGAVLGEINGDAKKNGGTSSST